MIDQQFDAGTLAVLTAPRKDHALVAVKCYAKPQAR